MSTFSTFLSGLGGSRQRRLKFNPESAQYREEAVRALRWGTQADRRNRDDIQQASPEVLLRAMNRLVRRGMKVRRTSRGVEWLLWRGEGRTNVNAKHQERGSWSIQPKKAARFAADAADRHEPNPHVTAAWVPMSAVLSVPFMYGSESKAWSDTAVPGSFMYRNEAEVIVEPFDPEGQKHYQLDPVTREYIPALPK